MNNKLGIVLLNYINYKDTIECIESLIRQDYKNFEIVVVDNNSQNDSLKIIKNNIGHIKNIHYIQNSTNLGFACGNNVGIEYLKQKLNCNFIFVLNTDTIFKSEHIISQIMSNYKENDNIGLINPMCFNKDGSLQVPYCLGNFKMIKETTRDLCFLLYQYIKNIFKIQKSFNSNKYLRTFDDIIKFKCIIQGPAYILTPDFFEHYNRLFPLTFLYREEIALKWYLHKAKLKTIYVKNDVIIHKEGNSSKDIKDGSLKKIKMQWKSYKKIMKLFFLNKEKIKKKF